MKNYTLTLTGEDGEPVFSYTVPESKINYEMNNDLLKVSRVGSMKVDGYASRGQDITVKIRVDNPNFHLDVDDILKNRSGAW